MIAGYFRPVRSIEKSVRVFSTPTHEETSVNAPQPPRTSHSSVPPFVIINPILSISYLNGIYQQRQGFDQFAIIHGAIVSNTSSIYSI